MMINKIKFDGLDAVEIVSGENRVVLVHEIGPRISFFGFKKGENLLYWAKEEVQRKQWKLYGGHRVWLTRPYADESEDTYIEDNERCTLKIEKNRVTAISPANFQNYLERGIEIETQPDGCFKVRNFITNKGDLIYSGGVWSPTCVLPNGKKIIIPLGVDDATWDIVKLAIPRVFAGNVTMLEDTQASFCGNDLVIEPKGNVLKRVCCAPKGKVLLDCGTYTFEKHSPFDKRLRYPFDGCNTAVFVGKNNFMAEMETFGGESEILPGETIENIEYWKIY